MDRRKAKRSARSKGFHYERVLARKLWSKGFAVVRGPGSGGGSSEIVQPDLIALKNGHIFAFEIKVRWKRTTIYLEKEKIERLKEFARRAKGRAFIAVKIVDKTDWRFLPVETIENTKKGNYKITPVNMLKGLTIDELNTLTQPVKKLDEYMDID
ncbi:MAG: Holliday junction resolvase [Desulfurococcales archaeon]|nr:Holliday junction resolvase [Desulfurococcales archaeon]